MVTTDVDIAKWQRFGLALMAPSTSQKSPTAVAIGLLGDPVGIRTPNLRIRSAMLYPVELQGLVVSQVRNGGQR